MSGQRYQFRVYIAHFTDIQISYFKGSGHSVRNTLRISATSAALAAYRVRAIGDVLQFVQHETGDDHGCVEEASFADIGDAAIDDYALYRARRHALFSWQVFSAELLLMLYGRKSFTKVMKSSARLAPVIPPRYAPAAATSSGKIDPAHREVEKGYVNNAAALNPVRMPIMNPPNCRDVSDSIDARACL